MRTKLSPAVVGAFVLGAFAIGIITLLALGSLSLFSKPQRFMVYFDESVSGLDQGSPVKLRGVRVGHVVDTSIRYDRATGKSLAAVLCELNQGAITDEKGGSFDVADRAALQELVDRGFYSPEEAQRAANKNYVTRALGVEPNVEVEVQEHPVQKGDLYLICSDGLSDMVEDEDIHLTMSTFGANLENATKQLIQLGNDNGGKDNISVVVAEIMESFPAPRGILDKMLGWFSST